jgi:hypothetical protein
MNGTTDFVRQLIHQEVSTGAVQKEEVGVCTRELRCCMSLHAGLDQVQGRDAHMVVFAFGRRKEGGHICRNQG